VSYVHLLQFFKCYLVYTIIRCTRDIVVPKHLITRNYYIYIINGFHILYLIVPISNIDS